MDQHSEPQHEPQPHKQLIHVIVEVDGKNRPVTLTTTRLLGARFAKPPGRRLRMTLRALCMASRRVATSRSTLLSKLKTATISSRCPRGR